MKKFFLFFLPLLLLADAHIFVFHRVGDNRYPSTNISPKLLEKDIKYVLSHGYKVVKLSTLVKRIQNHKNINKYVVFTIDDNFKSFYKNGLPIFKKYHIPFTLFVYVEATQKHYGDFMTWKEIKNALKYGELGIHSWAHPHLAMLTNKQIIDDTKKAIYYFKKNMGFVPNMYAYPYGEYNKRVKKIINTFFPIICNQNVGAVNDNSPINDLDRIAITGDVDIAKKLKLEVLNVKNLKIKRNKNIITQISGKVKYPYVFIYITKLGWKKIKTNNGFFDYKPNFKLEKYRNRIIIRYNNRIKTRLVLKEE